MQRLHKKLQRAHYFTIIWGNADSAHPAFGLDPLSYGWKEQNGFYTPEWFEGSARPDYLIKRQQEHSVEIDDLFDDDDGESSEDAWSDDSDSETEI